VKLKPVPSVPRARKCCEGPRFESSHINGSMLLHASQRDQLLMHVHYRRRQNGRPKAAYPIRIDRWQTRLRTKGHLRERGIALSQNSIFCDRRAAAPTLKGLAASQGLTVNKASANNWYQVDTACRLRPVGVR